jgi:hypothetical protein
VVIAGATMLFSELSEDQRRRITLKPTSQVLQPGGIHHTSVALPLDGSRAKAASGELAHGATFTVFDVDAVTPTSSVTVSVTL